MEEKPACETSVKPEVARCGNQTGAGDQKLVPLLQPDFALSDALCDVARQDRGKSLFIHSPLSRWQLGDISELFAVTNDCALELRNKTRRLANEKAPSCLQGTGHYSLKSQPDIFRHALFALVIIAVYANCGIKTRWHR